MKTIACLKYFVNGCLNFVNVNCLWKRFIVFNATFCLLDNYSPDLFTEVQMWYWKPFTFGLRRFFRKIKLVSVTIWLFLTIKTVHKEIKKQKKILQAIMFIIFWDFLVVGQIFLSPRVKWRVIFSNKLVYMSYPWVAKQMRT